MRERIIEERGPEQLKKTKEKGEKRTKQKKEEQITMRNTQE